MSELLDMVLRAHGGLDRAYEFPLERSQEPGRELDDWLQAEREINRLLPILAVAKSRFLMKALKSEDS